MLFFLDSSNLFGIVLELLKSLKVGSPLFADLSHLLKTCLLVSSCTDEKGMNK